MLRKLGFLLLLGCSTQSLAAQNNCNKIVISGDVAWPPYSFKQDGVLKGAGIELAHMLFGELDVTVEVKVVDTASDLGYMLRHGEVDLIVGTYDVPQYKHVVQLLTPAYFDDVINIVVPSNREFKFDEWNDLNGKAGVTTEGGQIGSKFTNYAADNLYVKKENNLKFVLKKIQKKQVDYAVGSGQQLKAGVASFAMEKDVKFMPEAVDKEAVYLGFASVSACQSYAPYVQNRLKELKENGTIDKLINKYTFDVKQDDPDKEINKVNNEGDEVKVNKVIRKITNKPSSTKQADKQKNAKDDSDIKQEELLEYPEEDLTYDVSDSIKDDNGEDYDSMLLDETDPLDAGSDDKTKAAPNETKKEVENNDEDPADSLDPENNENK